MKTVRVGINGLGRIGKGVISAWIERKFEGVDIVLINDIIEPSAFPHLLKYDSVHGRLGAEVCGDHESVTVGGKKKISLCSEREADKIPWERHGVDIVLECTGKFTDREKASLHLKGGAKKVIISAPAKNPDLTVVMGVNDKEYNPQKHNIVSNASCTTNCLAPTAKVLHDLYGIENGFMTTIHSYTNDQQILDRYHKDPRRARAGALSMIPTTTGAAKAIGLVLPDLAGKFDGMAIRVPTPNVSVVDLVANLKRPAKKEAINEDYEKAAAGPLKGILACSHEPLVSIDFNGSSVSATIDIPSTMMVQDRLVKVLAWYDNETGFSHRMMDLVLLLGKNL